MYKVTQTHTPFNIFKPFPVLLFANIRTKMLSQSTKKTANEDWKKQYDSVTKKEYWVHTTDHSISWTKPNAEDL